MLLTDTQYRKMETIVAFLQIPRYSPSWVILEEITHRRERGGLTPLQEKGLSQGEDILRKMGPQFDEMMEIKRRVAARIDREAMDEMRNIVARLYARGLHL